ncbi:hypothetical protein QTN25_001311 [Entamoeba marina]
MDTYRINQCVSLLVNISDELVKGDIGCVKTIDGDMVGVQFSNEHGRSLPIKKNIVVKSRVARHVIPPGAEQPKR